MASIDYDGIRTNKYNSYPNKVIRINGYDYIIQCPGKIDANTVFYVAGRGSGSIHDTDSMFKAAKGKNVIVIAPVHENGDSFPNSVRVIELLSKNFGIEPRATFSGHSNSGPLALKMAVRYIDKFDSPTVIVLNDPYNCGGDNIDYSKLKGSFILANGPKGASCIDGFMGRLKKAASAGAKVLIYRYNGTHGDADEVAASLGTYDMDNLRLLDKGSFVDYAGYKKTSSYTFQWIDSKGKVHNFKNAEEAQKYMDEALTEITGTLYEKCPTLAEFSERYNGATGTLASNLVFVNNCMNNLKNNVKSHTDINYTKGSDNEAGIVGAMYSATNYYGAVTNVLYGNISAEADAVYAIANAIYQMDGCAAVIAEGSLTDGIKKMFDPSNPTVAANLEALKKTSGELVDTAKNAVTAGGRYDELTNLLTGSVTAGNVGKISISSLESAVNAVVPSLNEEVSKAQGLKSSVDEFMTGIGSSSILQGGVWDAVKSNMEAYQNLLDCNMKAANFISDTIKTAMGVVVDYINGSSEAISAVAGTDYSSLVTAGELDDSKLPEITTTLEEIAKQIESLKTTIKDMEDAKEQVCSTPVGTEAPACEWVAKYSASDIQPYRDSLTKYETAQTALNTYATRLEGLAPIVENAQKMINDAISQVKSMYENPVTDTQGNQRFNADFKLDMSAYGFEKDASYYKQLINDYYDKLNPPKNIEETPADEEPGDDDDDDTYTGPIGGPDVPVIPTEAPTEATTETTEPPSEETEPPSEPPEPETTPTEPPSEASTETTEPQTEAPTGENETEPGGGGGSEHKPKPPSEEKPTAPSEVLTEMPTEEIFTEVETLPEEMPTEGGYEEDTIPEIIEITEPETIPEIEPEPSKGNGIKTMGIAAGVGLAVGAAALGAHTIMKSKEEDDDEYDYGYDK